MNIEALNDYLKNIKEKVNKGIALDEITVRKLLNILEVSRRGRKVNNIIDESLRKNKLEIEQGIEWKYIDNKIIIKSIEVNKININMDYRINVLKSANIKPISVKPDDDIEYAISIMISKNYSQLPVMQNDRNVKGVINWKTIALNNNDKKETKVNKYMERAIIEYEESSLFDVIDKIQDNDYILVKDKNDLIIGIVTSYDLSEHFSKIAEPFLLIGKCEYLIRKIIHCKFTEEELRECKNNNDNERNVSNINDLTFGEFKRLLEKNDNWKKLSTKIDKIYFIKCMDKTRIIRNDIMHFDPNVTNNDIINDIREFNRLLLKIAKEIKITI